MSLCKTGYQAIMRSNMDADTLMSFGMSARNAGITTVTDLAGTLVLAPDSRRAGKAVWQTVVNDPAFPARIAQYNIPAMPGAATSFDDAAEAILALQQEATDKLRFPGVKFVLDGSIQGWSALLNEPGYLTGEDHAFWRQAAAVKATVKALEVKVIVIPIICWADYAQLIICTVRVNEQGICQQTVPVVEGRTLPVRQIFPIQSLPSPYLAFTLDIKHVVVAGESTLAVIEYIDAVAILSP